MNQVCVIVKKLRFECIVGVLDFEREQSQTLEVSAKFVAEEFIDYGEVCADFQREFKARKFGLLEEAFDFFLQHFRTKFPTLKKLKITLFKPQIAQKAKIGEAVLGVSFKWRAK